MSDHTHKFDNFYLRQLEEEDLETFLALETANTYGKYSPFGKLTVEEAKEQFEVFFNEIKTLDQNKQIEENINQTATILWMVVNKNNPKKSNHSFAGIVGYFPVILNDKQENMFYISFSLNTLPPISLINLFA